MNRERAKELLPVIDAFAKGKIIEATSRNSSVGWYDCLHPDFEDNGAQWRIKPEPKYRPWKPEEVPVGACVKAKGHLSARSMILSVNPDASDSCVSSVDNQYALDYLLKSMEYSTDNGKTWQPCGVLE